MKPSPRIARALRLMERTGATITMHSRSGIPHLGDKVLDSEATLIGKQIKLQRANVLRMLDEGWIEVFNIEKSYTDTKRFSYSMTEKGHLALISLDENDFAPRRPYFSHDELKSIIQEWYTAGDGWIFLTELPILARRIDAYALGLWESMKYMSIGFEVKVSRSDLLADLKNEYKRAPAMKRCNQFYYVTTKGLARRMDLPDDVGLIEIWRNKSRHILIDAPVREIEDPSWMFAGLIAQRALREYHRRYNWNTGEWTGECREIPKLEEKTQ